MTPELAKLIVEYLAEFEEHRAGYGTIAELNAELKAIAFPSQSEEQPGPSVHEPSSEPGD